jgi:peptide/nickel transport system substrate-binding protein
MSVLSKAVPGRARLIVAAAVVAMVAGTLGGCSSSATGTPAAPPTETAASAAPSAAPASSAPSTAPATAMPTESAGVQPASGGTLVMARQQEPTTLNPIVSDNNGSIFVQMQIFEGLVEQVPTTLEPQAAIAESWEISPDGLTYTFHLRQTTFSNGDPITAEDVKFSLDRLFDPKIDASMGFLFGNVKGVTAVDASTVRVEMKIVDPALLSELTLPNAVIVPQKVMQALGEDGFGENPVGSGPFMLKSWARGQKVELVRNPHYWRSGQPYLDGITFLAIPDDNARLLKVQSGEAQIGDNTPVSQVSRLNGVAGLKVLEEPSMSTWQVALNNTLKPLDDKLVRQALNYATPKQVINDVVYAGTATIANSMIPILRFWDKSVPPYPYDVEKAKQLMAQSSAPNGFSIPFVIQSGDVMESQLATILQTEWAKIGVKLEIQSVDRATRLKRSAELDYGALTKPSTAQSSDITDDSEYASICFDGPSEWRGQHTGYNSAEATRLTHEAATTADSAKRAGLYSQLQKLTMDDAMMVPLLFAPQLTVVSDSVNGFATLPTGWWLLREVSVAK